jgi:hypothetical protein
VWLTPGATITGGGLGVVMLRVRALPDMQRVLNLVDDTGHDDCLLRESLCRSFSD